MWVVGANRVSAFCHEFRSGEILKKRGVRSAGNAGS